MRVCLRVTRSLRKCSKHEDRFDVMKSSNVDVCFDRQGSLQLVMMTTDEFVMFGVGKFTPSKFGLCGPIVGFIKSWDL